MSRGDLFDSGERVTVKTEKNPALPGVIVEEDAYRCYLVRLDPGHGRKSDTCIFCDVEITRCYPEMP